MWRSQPPRLLNRAGQAKLIHRSPALRHLSLAQLHQGR
jgi:hypothetical protein